MTALIEVTTRSGKRVESPFTDRGAHTHLRDLVGRGLPGSFPADLAGKEFDRLSPEQVKWVHVLAVEGTAVLAARDPNAPAPERGPNLMQLVELLRVAARTLKWPTLHLAHGERGFRITLSGGTSRNVGGAWITTEAAKDDREFLGSIDREGELHLRTPDANLTAALASCAADPVGHARLHGQRTGCCCFCGLVLTDGRSISAGYGPICAENWGLPWGGA